MAPSALAPPVPDGVGADVVSGSVGLLVIREPLSDFEISNMTAERSADGHPLVTATVANTGLIALEVTGTLWLSQGPGGSRTAGPFAAALGTTLAPGESAPVTIVVDEHLLDGPWQARLDLNSGPVERTAQATLVFPDAGAEAEPEPVDELWWVPILVGIGVTAVFVVAGWWLLRRRWTAATDRRRP